MSEQARVNEDENAGSAGGAGRPASVIGVLGAGTMGAGIAQLAARSGARTLLHDPFGEALARGLASAEDGLRKEMVKGRLSEEDAAAAAERLQPAEDMAAFADCELVIEAAPERLELKHEMYAKLSEIVSEECVLATNTSSLLVTAIATGASHPERVVGMHFFNPAPLMRLLEVVAGVESSPTCAGAGDGDGRGDGQDGDPREGRAGVHRQPLQPAVRPRGSAHAAGAESRTCETIDRICRMEGGFRMGPFELMDLVGVDTGFEISKSFYEQGFGEPRWRPSMIAARYVAAGLHGRKSGRGYYDYSQVSSAHRAQDPEPLEPGVPGSDGEGVVVIAGESTLAEELRAAARGGGLRGALAARAERAACCRRWWWTAARPPRHGSRRRALPAAGRTAAVRRRSRRAARACCCARKGRWGRSTRAAARWAFTWSRRWRRRGLVELTRSEGSSPVAAARAERFFATLGKHVQWVGDAPGLVLGQDRLPGDQRVGVRARRRRGRRARHRHGHGARTQPPARPAGVGGHDRPGPRADGAGGAVR